jgi:hypothetical protein
MIDTSHACLDRLSDRGRRIDVDGDVSAPILRCFYCRPKLFQLILHNIEWIVIGGNPSSGHQFDLTGTECRLLAHGTAHSICIICDLHGSARRRRNCLALQEGRWDVGSRRGRRTARSLPREGPIRGPATISRSIAFLRLKVGLPTYLSLVYPRISMPLRPCRRQCSRIQYRSALRSSAACC